MPNNSKINKLGMLLLCFTIVTFNLIIGGNEKSLPILVIGLITGLSLLLLLIKKIKYKEKLIKSKIDIVVSILMMTLLLPLVFNTYCTYQGTVEFILKYFFVYAMYLLARNVVDTQKKINILVATTIFSSLIIIILGFDKLYGINNFKWLIENLNLFYKQSYRFSSTFGYANAVSIYLTFCIFLAINRFENTRKKTIKTIYVLYILLATYVIYLSYSRFVLIIYILTLLTYLGFRVYKRFKENKRLLKTIVTIVVVIIMIILIYFAIAIKYSKPYRLDKENEIKKRLDSNTEYIFSFNIDYTKEVENSNCCLQIIEVNNYFKEIELGRIELNEKQKDYNISIKTSEDVYYLKISDTNNRKDKIVINKLYINGGEYIFSYKYIPRVISRLITSFNIVDSSVHQRIQFYENCFRIAKDSPLIGHGGNTWKKLSFAYEEYPYSVKETHSYFFELLISYGIVGIIVFITIIVLFVKNYIKDVKYNKINKGISIFVGLMLFVIYSFIFDFTMSYILTILIVFIYIAILQVNNNKIINNKKCYMIVEKSSLVVISVVFIILLKANIAKYIIKDDEAKYKIVSYDAYFRARYVDFKCENKLEGLKEIMLKEPYTGQNYRYKLYWNTLFNKSKELPEERLLYYFDFGIDRFKTIKPESPMYFDFVEERTQIMVDIIKKFKTTKSEEVQKRLNILKRINKRRI